jgi:RHS repeat-associated protein
MGSDTYTYDANGNQITRNVGGSSYTLSYDAENRLISVSGAVTATFVYDGDGNRVKGTVAGVTATYVGNYFEWKTNTTDMKKYYYAGSTRVAMCTGTNPFTPNFLLGDHLGSTAITVSISGTKTAELRYYPWGTTRYTYGSSPTTFQFTGQRLETSLGLYFYNARWFDPSLARFIQADTVVPGGVQGLDRYAYSYNNPVKYKDPSGRLSCDAAHVAEGDCSDVTIINLIGEYNVTVTGDWNPLEGWNLLQALDAMGSKLADSMVGEHTSSEAFQSVYTSMEFNMWDGQCERCWGRSLGVHEIRFYRHYTYTDTLGNDFILDTKIRAQLVVHELGHSLEFAITDAGGKAPSTFLKTDMAEDRDGLAGPQWVMQQSEDISATEIYADMVIGWVYNIWYTGDNPEYIKAGIGRQYFMNQYMPLWLQTNFP